MIRDDFVRNAAIQLMATVPGFDYDAAVTTVLSHITDGGGWVVEDGEPVNGEGEPQSGESIEEAVDAIEQSQLTRTKTLFVEVPIVVRLAVTGSYANGTTDSDILTASQNAIQARIETVTRDGLEVKTFDFDNAELDLRDSGILTTQNKLDIQSEITNEVVLTDPCAIAVAYARRVYGLDLTWMAWKLHRRSTGPIHVFIKKFTTSGYTTVDESFEDDGDSVTYEGYVVVVEPTALAVSTCLISPKRIRTAL